MQLDQTTILENDRRNPMVANLSATIMLLLALTAVVSTSAYFSETKARKKAKQDAYEKAILASNSRNAFVLLA